MAPRERPLSLALQSVDEEPASEGGSLRVRLHTDVGTIECRRHEAPGATRAVLWVYGAGGGFNGPAGGMYPRLAQQLLADGLDSLRVDYRRAGDLEPCILDALAGVVYLGERGRRQVILVGHSFGGAVAIAAGAASTAVIGVAALSSQTYGAAGVGDLSPRPLLLIHGTQDDVLPDTCSREIYRRAGEPKQLLLYPGCGHGLDECRDLVDRDLLTWIRQVAIHGDPPRGQFLRTQ